MAEEFEELVAGADELETTREAIAMESDMTKRRELVRRELQYPIGGDASAC